MVGQQGVEFNNNWRVGPEVEYAVIEQLSRCFCGTVDSYGDSAGNGSYTTARSVICI